MGSLPCNTSTKRPSFFSVNKSEKNSKKSMPYLSHENIPPLENLSFFAQKGGEDNYFSPSEICYYSKNIENTMMDAKKSLQESKIRWKPGEFLGQGSFASVIMGFNEETGQIMAVKQVRLNEAAKLSNVVASIKLEIDLLSRLKHKNIVSYIGAMTHKKTLNIFLEYISGGSVSSLIRKYGKLNENIVRLYTAQILQGLEYLHWNGVMHRDIKGANVLVETSGCCKLTDFGSSRNIMEVCSNNTLTGTANWMAPEVIKQTGRGGRFSDIWSVGCTVIEMATGKPPFSHYGNPITTMFKIANNNEPPELPGYLSSEIVDFLKNCFYIEPQQRMNCYKLLRHPFITGKVSLLKDVNSQQNGDFVSAADFRKQKKLLSAIPEKEEIIEINNKPKVGQNGTVLSLTKLENEMVLSIVESDQTNVNNMNKCSFDDYKNSFLSNINFNGTVKEKDNSNECSQISNYDDNNDFDFCNEQETTAQKMTYSFKVLHHHIKKLEGNKN